MSYTLFFSNTLEVVSSIDILYHNVIYLQVSEYLYLVHIDEEEVERINSQSRKLDAIALLKLFSIFSHRVTVGRSTSLEIRRNSRIFRIYTKVTNTYISEFPIPRHSYAIDRHSGFILLEYLHLVCSQSSRTCRDSIAILCRY